MNKWPDHTFGICPYCGGHMGIFAPTYAFNFCFAGCPHCGEESQSAYVDGTFQWVVPDPGWNRICVESHEMVQSMMEGERKNK